jgi:glutaredoxin
MSESEKNTWIIDMPQPFEEPDPYGYTVYTKSLCIFCDRVKALFEKEQLPFVSVLCDFYLEHNKEAFLGFIKERTGIEYKTFPMVFYKGQFIGGFTDTETHFNKQNAFDHLEFGEN